MNPVFGRLADKILLTASGGRITLDGITFGTDKIIKLRKLNDERIVIVIEKRLRIQSCSKDWPQVPSSLFLKTE